jgi:hypothetical protein
VMKVNGWRCCGRRAKRCFYGVRLRSQIYYARFGDMARQAIMADPMLDEALDPLLWGPQPSLLSVPRYGPASKGARAGRRDLSVANVGPGRGLHRRADGPDRQCRIFENTLANGWLREPPCCAWCNMATVRAPI